MTQTLQRIGESKLFAIFEQVLSMMFKELKIKNKRSFHHIVSTKERKTLQKCPQFISSANLNMFRAYL